MDMDMDMDMDMEVDYSSHVVTAHICVQSERQNSIFRDHLSVTDTA